MSRIKRAWECPESVSGHDDGGRTDGRCTWCGRRLGGPARRPDRFTTIPGDHTILNDAYRYAHDPDWGSDDYDT